MVRKTSLTPGEKRNLAQAGFGSVVLGEAGGITTSPVWSKVAETQAQANSRIDITFPPLTGYLNWNGGVVRDVTEGTDVGACSSPSNGAIQCYLFSGRSIDPGASGVTPARSRPSP